MESNDVLAEFDTYSEPINELESNSDSVEENYSTQEEDYSIISEDSPVVSEDNLYKQEEAQLLEEYINKVSEEKGKDETQKIKSSFKFILKYSLTSVLIFSLLLVTTNYSAYLSILESTFFNENLVKSEKSLVNSVKASHIKEKILAKKERTQEEYKQDEKITINEGDPHSINKLIANTNKNIDLGIEITPYEDRIIIPKIGKNIPLVEVKGQSISGENELNDIFMKELENGVVRYPGSAKPGNDGNSFIFGHSSNFPWIKGDYNEVFALLDNVNFDDEIIVYYGQKKHTYKVREKRITKPGDVSLLKNTNDKSEITLMTCWPIGTTLNRLIVVGDLVEG